MGADWNVGLYEAKHSFVWQFGRDLLQVLAPQAGERILDVGCGTGRLSAEIASSGAEVVGIDYSPTMVSQARDNFPILSFETQDACTMPYHGEFHAVFSNAALHWMQPAEEAAAAMSRALKPGGRLVVELGGRGNIQVLVDAAYAALRQFGIADPERYNPWYFPSAGEYATVLEHAGLEVTLAAMFDRPTPLEGGDSSLQDWFAMFGARLTEGLQAARIPDFMRLVKDYAAPFLFRDGQWIADYRRLRIVARKT
jgi:trans-aconitate methyltransferase